MRLKVVEYGSVSKTKFSIFRVIFSIAWFLKYYCTSFCLLVTT